MKRKWLMLKLPNTVFAIDARAVIGWQVAWEDEVQGRIYTTSILFEQFEWRFKGDHSEALLQMLEGDEVTIDEGGYHDPV